jgi:hypothetical protein
MPRSGVFTTALPVPYSRLCGARAIGAQISRGDRCVRGDRIPAIRFLASVENLSRIPYPGATNERKDG